MRKNFKQYIADLESGLNSIKNIMKEIGGDRRKYEKAKKNKEIQEARIEFLKIGYNLWNREIKEQRELGG